MLDVSLKAAPVTPEIPIKSREDKKNAILLSKVLHI